MSVKLMHAKYSGPGNKSACNHWARASVQMESWFGKPWLERRGPSALVGGTDGPVASSA